MGEKTYRRHFDSMRYEPHFPEALTQAAIISHSKRLYRQCGLLVSRREPSLHQRFLERSTEPLQLGPEHRADLAELMPIVWHSMKQRTIGNALATQIGEAYAVRLLRALEEEIDGISRRTRSNALDKLNAFEVPSAASPRTALREIPVLRLEALSALDWLSLVMERKDALRNLSKLLNTLGMPGSSSSFDNWQKEAAERFYSDPELPDEIQDMDSGANLPKAFQFTPRYAGDCSYCGLTWHRGDQYIICDAAFSAPATLRDLCPGYGTSDYSEALENYISFQRTMKDEGWFNAFDDRVSDSAVISAWMDIATRVLTPLAERISSKKKSRQST